MSSKRNSQRCEYRYDANHPAYAFFAKRAELLGISIQRVIDMAAKEWFAMTQQGQTPLAMLQAPQPEEVPSDQPGDGAREIAEQWM